MIYIPPTAFLRQIQPENSLPYTSSCAGGTRLRWGAKCVPAVDGRMIPTAMA